jgi:hypothetical protein
MPPWPRASRPERWRQRAWPGWAWPGWAWSPWAWPQWAWLGWAFLQWAWPQWAFLQWAWPRRSWAQQGTWRQRRVLGQAIDRQTLRVLWWWPCRMPFRKFVRKLPQGRSCRLLSALPWAEGWNPPRTLPLLRPLRVWRRTPPPFRFPRSVRSPPDRRSRRQRLPASPQEGHRGRPAPWSDSRWRAASRFRFRWRHRPAERRERPHGVGCPKMLSMRRA